MSPKDFAKKLVELWKLDDKDACYALCDQEQENLLKKYAQSTVIKTLTPKYRRAIAEESELVYPTLNYGYNYREFPVAFWRVDEGSNKEIEANSKRKVDTKSGNPLPSVWYTSSRTQSC